MIISPAHFLYGQISIDFENGNLNKWVESRISHWSVSSVEPLTGTFSLHHNWDSPVSSHDQISLVVPDLHIEKGTTIWRFKIRHAYPPSSANNWAVYLIADESALEMTPNGQMNAYVLGVNFTGSDDYIKLWRCNNSKAPTIILTTGYNWQNQVSVDSCRAFEMERSETGLWTLKVGADYNNLTTIGQVNDNTIVVRGYFGIYYEYSSAQDRKFWFDDLFIDGPFIPDTLAPEIQSVKVTGSNRLSLEFNESIQPLNLADTQLFFVDHDMGHPERASISNSKFVSLQFHRIFRDKITYMLNVNGLADLSGNKLQNDTVSFLFYVPKPYDILINEIMADPVPPMGLPEAEYIELKNVSPFSLSMVGWSLQIDGKNRIIPSINFSSGDFLILSSESDTSAFSKFGKTLGIGGFPNLPNGGGNVNVQDSTGNVISNITYNSHWYGDTFKADGGWALEQIDETTPCQGFANWKASTDVLGGTPGRENSVIRLNPDPDPPELTNAYVESDSIVIACFNEPYNRELATIPSLFEVDKEFGNPQHIETIPPDFTKIRLTYSVNFKPFTIYTLEVNPPFSDCAGNEIGEKNHTAFGIPSQADSLNLVINEVLFHPYPGGVDFVEIYNRSQKIINLEDIRIATRDPETWKLTAVYPVSNIPYLLMPGVYVAITIDPEVVMDQYPENNASGILKLPKMPALPANEGSVVLSTKWFEVLDEFRYDEGMHFPLLNSTAGVSLERIQPDKSTTDPANWHSAAEDIGFATPGVRNSQFVRDQYSLEPIIMEPEIFSPDNDGYNDVTQLKYHFEEPGYVADIMIFNAKGLLIRQLANNELLGTEGSFIWDGLNEVGMKAPLGIYLCFVKVFNLKGKVMAFKTTCVLATRFN